MSISSTIQFKEFSKNIFSRDELNSFRLCNRTRLLVDISLIWGQALLGILIICNFSSVWFSFLGILIVGSAQHGLSLVAHEGAHTLLSGSRRLNDFFARWFFAAPVLLPFDIYRRRHFEHHLYACTDRDTKDLYRQKITGIYLFIELIKSASGFDFFKQVFSVLKHSSKNFSSTQSSDKKMSFNFLYDIFSICISQLVILIVFCALSNFIYYLFAWLLPLFTVNMLCGKLRSIVEHQPLTTDSPNLINSQFFKGMGTPFCRSISPTFFERFFLTKINFCYHAEHHLYPSVSYQFLPQIHDRIAIEDDGVLLANGYSHRESYLKVLFSLFSDFK